MEDEVQKQSNELQQPEPNELEAKLAAAEQQRDEYLAGWQRTKADFINYKKEEFKRMEEIKRISFSACAGIGDPVTKCIWEPKRKAFVLCIGNFSPRTETAPHHGHLACRSLLA